MSVLPEIRSSSEVYGQMKIGPLQSVPISGVIKGLPYLLFKPSDYVPSLFPPNLFMGKYENLVQTSFITLHLF